MIGDRSRRCNDIGHRSWLRAPCGTPSIGRSSGVELADTQSGHQDPSIALARSNPLICRRRAVGMVCVSRPLGSHAQWQLAQPSTPVSTVVEIVGQAAGTAVEQVDRIVEGYSNEVYQVRCTDGQEVIVRILRFDDDVTTAVSAGEAAAIAQARAAGVPAPEVLLLDTVGVDGSTFPVMVQRTVPGRPLREIVDDLSEGQRHDVLVELGGLVARLNSVVVDDARDWPTAMAADLGVAYADRDNILAGGFSAPQFERMLRLLEGYVRDFHWTQWVLCHRDLSTKHIFVTGDGRDGTAPQISGIIDFGDWRPGVPVHDLAVLRVRSPGLDLSPVLAGYGASDDRTFRRNLDLHTLLIALSSLAFGVAEGDQACIHRVGHLIRTLVDDLDKQD